MSGLNPIRTPCIGVCSTGIGDAVCRGCKRFAHEVIDWNGYSQAQKQAIDARLDRFLAMCVANKLRIVDQKLLDWQLSVQKIRHQAHHDPYCHLFALLKAGATQIAQPEQYGFEVMPSCRGMTLVALRDQIDEEFWVLSAAHYDRYDMENRYTGMWVAKKIPANWKATAEAFMEAWHSVTTHPQLLPFLGDANSRYDHIGDHFNRAITPSGVLSPHLAGKDQRYVLDKMNQFSGGSDADTNRRFAASEEGGDFDENDPLMARKVLADAGRKGFAEQYGYDYSDASDAEILDNFTYNIFPNFSPWIGYLPTLCYRWPPGDTPDWCIMEIRLLFPTPKGEKRPKSVERLYIPDDEPFAWAKDTMGEALAGVFDQDMANLPHVQTGMKAMKDGMMELGHYQDSRVRHFQTTLMKYINGELPA